MRPYSHRIVRPFVLPRIRHRIYATENLVRYKRKPLVGQASCPSHQAGGGRWNTPPHGDTVAEYVTVFRKYSIRIKPYVLGQLCFKSIQPGMPLFPKSPLLCPSACLFSMQHRPGPRRIHPAGTTGSQWKVALQVENPHRSRCRPYHRTTTRTLKLPVPPPGGSDHTRPYERGSR